MEAERVVEETKQKRIRKAPYRKWSDQEQQELVNFLRDNKPIEKPTAQLFYKRFLHQIGSELEWTVVRCKVKNLRQSYIKAKSWHNSTGAGTMQDSGTTRDVVERMCPLYNSLEDIFGYREFESNASVVDTEDSNTQESTSNADVSPNFAISLDEESIDAASPETPRATQKTVRKGIYSRTALADVLEVHSSLVELKKGKFEAESKIREKELELKEKIFLFDKEKHASQEKFKLLDLEMRERIALKEIEMKERLELEKLKMFNKS